MVSSLRRAVNRVHLLRQRPSPRHIVALTYALTYRCNSRCAHCATWQDTANRTPPPFPELTADQVAGIWETNAAYFTQLQSLQLTGGEPFLRRDLPEILDRALTRFPKARVHLSTNGLNGERIVEVLSQVRDPRRVCVAFSLDGPAPVYAQIRGVDRFDDVVAVARRVRAAVPAMAVGLNVTVMPGNATHLSAIRAIAADIGADFGMQVAHASAFYHNAGQDVTPRPEDVAQMARVADDMAKAHRRTHGVMKALVDVEPYYLAHMAERALARLPRPASQPCYSGTHSLFMDPYGFVYPCIMLSAPLGRLPQQTLGDFWHGAQACDARNDIAKGACQCWTSCEAFPSLSRDVRVVAWNLRALVSR